MMEKGIWQEIEELYMEFQQLGISQSVDYEKYYLYSLITHSTAIEGSTLTEMDAQLLFDEGVTAKGKPLVYHLMNEDLKKAYELAKKEAQRNTVITPAFLQKLKYNSSHRQILLSQDFLLYCLQQLLLNVVVHLKLHYNLYLNKIKI